MKRCNSLLLAASSVIWCVSAVGTTRPHYGGTLRIAVREAPQTLEPAELAQGRNSNIIRLLFDTLVMLDDRGQLVCPWHGWRWDVRSGRNGWPGTDWRVARVPVRLVGDEIQLPVLD